jgi:hypothetical protein
MWGSGFGLLLFLAGYKWRIEVGFYINRMYKIKWLFNKWSLGQDFKNHIFMRDLHTREEMLDFADKRSMSAVKSND